MRLGGAAAAPQRRKGAIAAALVAVLSSAAPAGAADPDTFRCEAYPSECGLPAIRTPPADPLRVTRGVQLGVRVGFALPVGSLTGPIPTEHAMLLSDLFTASVPLGVDVGYRLSRALYLGGSFSWAPGIGGHPFLASPCAGGSSPCRLLDTQLATDARLYLAPDETIGPWIAGGVGWEWMAVSPIDPAASSALFSGPVLDAQVGIDWRKGAFAMGPVLAASLGEYVVRPASAEPWTGFDVLSMHAWITLGVRGSYGPW